MAATALSGDRPGLDGLRERRALRVLEATNDVTQRFVEVWLLRVARPEVDDG